MELGGIGNGIGLFGHGGSCVGHDSQTQARDDVGFSFCVAVVGLVYAIVMPAQEWAFAASVGTMALLSAVSLIVVRRTAPHPGSEEEAQLEASARAIESVV